MILFNHVACIRDKTPDPEEDEENKPTIFLLDDSNHSLVLNLKHEEDDVDLDQMKSCIKESDLHRALQADPTFEELVSQFR